MASVAVYLALAVFFLVWPDTFICYGHNTAAIALFVGVVGVVGVNGVALTRKTDASGKAWDVRALNRYGVGFLVMVASIVVVLLIGPIKHLVDQWVFWLEFVHRTVCDLLDHPDRRAMERARASAARALPRKERPPRGNHARCCRGDSQPVVVPHCGAGWARRSRPPRPSRGRRQRRGRDRFDPPTRTLLMS